MPRLDGRGWRLLLSTAVALACSQAAAQTKPARCTTTDDGAYPCRFQATGRDGSFAISAPGKPTYAIVVDEPGVAAAFLQIGGRSVALPGRYLRSASDPSCWVGEATNARICAR